METRKIDRKCVMGPENIPFAGRFRTSFSPEIVQAGAVKGLY